MTNNTASGFKPLISQTVHNDLTLCYCCSSKITKIATWGHIFSHVRPFYQWAV